MTKPPSKNTGKTPLWLQNLRELMDGHNLNPRSLSLKAGLNQTAVRDMLEGRVKFPRYDTIQALAETLGTSTAQLMGERTSVPQKFDEDTELLTEIISRLDEETRAQNRKLSPSEFASMVTTIYRRIKQSDAQKKPFAAIQPKIHDLLEYEAIRTRKKA